MSGKLFTREEIKKRLSPVFIIYDIKEARLFGSYAKNVATEKSDIDLYVDSNLKGLKFVGFMESVREALDGKDVDILDKSHIQPDSRVDNEIKTTGKVIYAR